MNSSEKDLSTIIGYYLEEWKHRDNIYIKHTYTYFWSILIVSLFPNIEFISNNLVKIINPKVFNVLGLVLSVAFLYITLSLGKRLTKVGEKYDSLLKKLNTDYCHEKIDNNFPSL